MPLSASRVLVGTYVAGLLAVTALWWAAGPSSDGTLDAARLTGLLAAYLLAVQIVLRARIPYVERNVDTGQLARWHRSGGLALVLLACCHAVLVVAAYSHLSRRSLLAEARSLVLSYPDVLMAATALALFLVVAFLAARPVRRRLRYETWAHAHLYVYLAAGLSVAHQLANGEHLRRYGWLRPGWLLTLLALAATVLWFRVGRPLWRSASMHLRVAAVEGVAPGVTTVTVSGRKLDRLGARPGQFFRWRFVSRGRWWSANPYSLSAVPRDGQLRLTAKAVGDHSSGLAALAPGTRVVAEGPYGALTSRRRHGGGAVLIAAGIGITPLRALFETIPAGPSGLDLIYRARTGADVLFRDELDAIAAARDARVHYLVGSRHENPLGPDDLRRLVPDVADRAAYLCGPPGFTTCVAQALHEAGMPRVHIHREQFALDVD